MIFYLGVDPSLTNTGVVVIKEEYGEYFLIEHHLIKTKPSQDCRLLYISTGLKKICKPFQLEKVFIEYPLVNCNSKTSIALSQAVGAIALTLEGMDLELIYLMPSEVKKVITGKGNGDKDLMRKCIVNHINIPHNINDISEHEIDACGIACAGLILNK